MQVCSTVLILMAVGIGFAGGKIVSAQPDVIQGLVLALIGIVLTIAGLVLMYIGFTGKI